MCMPVMLCCVMLSDVVYVSTSLRKVRFVRVDDDICDTSRSCTVLKSFLVFSHRLHMHVTDARPYYLLLDLWQL